MPEEYGPEKEIRDWSQSICPLTMVTSSPSLCYGGKCPMFNERYNSCAVVTYVKGMTYNVNQIGRAAYAFNRSLFKK